MGMDGFTKQTYKKYWRVLQDFYGSKNIVTQGQVCLVSSFGTGAAQSNGTTFQFFPAGGTPALGNNQLNTSDAFFAIQHGFAIAKSTSSSAASLRPETFPNAYTYTDATDLAAQRALYWQGKLNITIDSKVYYNNYPISNFEEAGVAQEGLPLTGAGTNVYARDVVDGEVSGVRDLIPTIFFNGDSNVSIEVKLPAPYALGGNGTTYNFAIMRYYGFYIQGGKLDKNTQVPQLMQALRGLF